MLNLLAIDEITCFTISPGRGTQPSSINQSGERKNQVKHFFWLTMKMLCPLIIVFLGLSATPAFARTHTSQTTQIVHAAASCTVKEVQLPYQGYEFAILYNLQTGVYYHLQKNQVNAHWLAYVYKQGVYQGYWDFFNGYYPLDSTQTAILTLKTIWTYQTWLGSVSQVMKSVPTARYCQENWQLYWQTQDGQIVTGAVTTATTGHNSQSLVAPTTISGHIQAASCAFSELELPWFGYHYLILQRSSGATYVLQRYVYSGHPTVVVFPNFTNEAQYYINSGVQFASDLIVYMKSTTVYNISNGRVYTYTLTVPVARFCTGSFTAFLQYPQWH